jgi:Malic enzyme, NAD binding domain
MAGTSALGTTDGADLTTSFSGYHLLRDPMLNKGTAFSDAERDEFDLHVSDTMFMAAALALAEASPTRQDKTASLLPPVAALREVSFKVALAVGLRAQEEGLAAKTERGALEAAIRAKMWTPAYRPYRRVAG